MIDLLNNNYELVKALHLFSVVAWMAGMLYLPRLFVYHCDAKKGSKMSETFKVMERKLLRVIINPAMILSWTFGLLMLYAQPELLQVGWMHIKLTCVVLMTILHIFFARWRKDFEKDKNTRPQKFYRFANEMPTILIFAIIIVAVMKPSF